MSLNKSTISVSELTFQLKKIIESNFSNIWIQGEISNFKHHSSGHMYFTLKDKSAELRCVMFRGYNQGIHFKPEDGMDVILQGKITVYETRGQYQLMVQNMEPAGIGTLFLAFEALKKQLQLEGIFDNALKKQLPQFPKKVGIVTSQTGAAFKDMVQVLNRRAPYVDILLRPTLVQGDNAANDIVEAIKEISLKNIDVLIIGRGGGSLEDLWAFNEEVLARAIFMVKTPLISAVGHETDTTIADFVSDVRAPTPSAAAMMATPDRLELLSNTDKLYLQLRQFSKQKLTLYKHQINQLKIRIPTPSKQLYLFSQQLDYFTSRLSHQTKTIVGLNQGKLTTLFEQLKQHSPIASIQHKKEINVLSKQQLTQQIYHLVGQNNSTLHALSERLEQSINALVESQKNKLSSCIIGLNHLSPLNTLSRGYSITSTDNNQVLLSKNTVKIGSSITTQLADGKIYSKVSKIENN